MKYTNSAEYDAAISDLIRENVNLIDTCKSEIRSLTDEENTIFDQRAQEINTLKAEKDELLRSIENNDTLKNISIDKKMNTNEISLQRALSAAYAEGSKTVDMNRAYTVGSEGEDVVPVDIWEVMRPLLEEKVFNKIGARIETNLHDNVQIPMFNAGAAAWVSETGDASDGSGSFTSVNLSPKRFACYIPISKKFLIQAVPSGEARIREDIANQALAIIENQIWSATAASEIQPAGLLNGKTATEVSDYKGLVNLEADLRANKFQNVTAVLSPHAEAEFKAMIKGTNATGMVLDNSRLDGLNTFVTSILENTDFVLIDGTQLVVGFWGNTEIQFFEDSFYAKKGQVCLVLNGYADFKLARPAAIEYAKVVTE